LFFISGELLLIAVAVMAVGLAFVPEEPFKGPSRLYGASSPDPKKLFFFGDRNHQKRPFFQPFTQLAIRVALLTPGSTTGVVAGGVTSGSQSRGKIHHRQ
jgi:hypothetical protein